MSISANIGAHDSELIASSAAAWASSIVFHQTTSIQRSPSASYASSRETNPGCALIQVDTGSTVPSSCSRDTRSRSLNTTSSMTFGADDAIACLLSVLAVTC